MLGERGTVGYMYNWTGDSGLLRFVFDSLSSHSCVCLCRRARELGMMYRSHDLVNTLSVFVMGGSQYRETIKLILRLTRKSRVT